MKTILLAVLAPFLVPQDDTKILEFIDRLRSEDSQARRDALTALQDTGTAGVALALRTLANETPGLADRIDKLVAQLSSRAWKERDEAMNGLARLGRRALERLATHEKSANEETAWRVKGALAAIREKEKSEQVTDLQRDTALCEYLGTTGDARAVEPLFKVLKAEEAGPPEILVDLRLRAAEGLGRLRKSMAQEMADQTAEVVLKMVENNKNRRVRNLLVKTLGALRSPAAVRPLVMLLDDPAEKDLHFKRNAMAALVALESPWGVRRVVKLLQSDEPYLREAALQTLKPAAGMDFGIDPSAGPAKDAEFGLARSWWEKKYGKAWDQEE